MCTAYIIIKSDSGNHWNLLTYKIMRKNVKSSLYQEFKSVADDGLDNADMHIIDEDHLLHVIKWNFKSIETYQDLPDKHWKYLRTIFFYL